MADPVPSPPIFLRQVGHSPLLVSIPHAGTFIPPAIAARLTPAGRAVPDTDWHVDRLYGFLAELDVTVLTATHSRYVVDLNRSPEGGLLYPGQVETGICPTETFAGAPIYLGDPADNPGAEEVSARVATYWQPYHDALRGEIARLRALHGVVHVLDGHSIHGTLPRLFAGDLPDLNVGTNDGASAGAALTARVMAAVAGHGFSHVLNGRFKGGAITRGYGAPALGSLAGDAQGGGVPDGGVHVVQLEMAWRAYLDEGEPARYDPARAAPLIGVLRQVAAAMAHA